MNAVLYCRYSSDNQTENSIEGQLRECKEFAQRNGIAVLGTYIDRAYSATTDKRPEFQKMIKDSAKHLFDTIIVWKLDRFARNRYDSAHNKAILRKNGVKVISATERISEGSDGILLESVLEGYAEYFSAELAEKVVRGMRENALKCQWNGGGIPVGYVIDENKHYQIGSLTAPLVLEAYQKYDKGATIREIEIWLGEKGVQSWIKKPMRFDAVNRMLKNRAYIGEYHFRDVIIPGGVPAIVSEDLFERVQQRMAKNKKAPSRHKAEDNYLLTTKLFCGHCGKYMVGECGTSRTGATYRYYKCVSVKKRWGCHKKSIKKDWIENLVVDEAVQMLLDDMLVESIVDRVMELQKKENTAIPLLRQQLLETEKAIDNMLNAIQQGVLTTSTKSRLEKLEETKSKLEVAIIQKEMQKPTLTREFITFFIHRFRNTDVTDRVQRQRLIDCFINAIYVYDDKLVLTFNYKEDSKTVSLKEIEDTFGSDLNAQGVPRRRIVRAIQNPAFTYGDAGFCVYLAALSAPCKRRYAKTGKKRPSLYEIVCAAPPVQMKIAPLLLHFCFFLGNRSPYPPFRHKENQTCCGNGMAGLPIRRRKFFCCLLKGSKAAPRPCTSVAASHPFTL